MSFRKPKINRQKTEIEWTDRQNKIAQEYKDLGLEYIPDGKAQKENLYALYEKKYPETFTRSVDKLIKCEQNGQIWLVWVETQSFRDEYHQKQSEVFRFGSHPLPMLSPKYSREGDIQDLDVESWRIVPETPFTVEFVNELLEKSRTPPTELMCARLAKTGKSIAFSSNKYSIFNLKEFIEGSFSELFGAAELGGFLSPEYGGLAAYKEYKKKHGHTRAGTEDDNRE